MKFSVEREQLLRPLQLTHAVVERRQTLPVLGNVLLELKGDELRLTATDLEVEMSVPGTGVTGETDGDVTLPARKLLDLCRASPEGTLLRFEVQAERAIVRAGRARFTLATLPASEFPRIDLAGEAHRLTLAQADLRRLLQGTHFAMAQQDVRYYLNGLLIELNGNRLRLVATDGHRMAVGEMRVGVAAPEARRLIAPRKSVVEMLRVLDDGSDDASLSLARDHFTLTVGRVEFRSKVIDGNFPDYERVIPRNCDKQVDAPREGLRAALARAAILSNEKLRAVRLELATGRLRMRASNAENEEAEEELEVSYVGDDLDIGFNVAYLLDALAAMGGAQARLAFSDAASSALLSDPDDAAFQYVVMPMRL